MSPITVVCCVEPGPLEDGTLRLIGSLRRWGGAYRESPVLAVRPPGFPRLAAKTRRALESLGATLVVRPPHSRYRWFQFIHKPLAMVLAERIAQTDQICFLDSDILVLGEPRTLILSADEDFVACAPGVEQGSRGPGDTFEPLWAELCAANKIAPDDLPWLTTARKGERIRLYWNGGVFNVRRGKGFGAEYLAATERILDAHVRNDHPGFGLGICEQSAIGFAHLSLGLRWRQLPGSYNYNMGTKTHAHRYRIEDLAYARLLHYHDCMWPNFFETFSACLRDTHPEVYQWLKSQGPMTNPASPLNRLLLRYRREHRRTVERRFVETCRVCGN